MPGNGGAPCKAAAGQRKSVSAPHTEYSVDEEPKAGNGKHAKAEAMSEERSSNGPFLPGVLVLVSLSEPREKFWGAILALTPAGLSIRGIDLDSFDDSAAMVRAGEPFTPSAVFFPMHRVERIELDAAEGDIP